MQEPSLDGRWVMDETLILCMGDCDLARANMVNYIEHADSVVPNRDEATPVATPQA